MTLAPPSSRNFPEVDLIVEHRPDGSVLLGNRLQAPPEARTLLQLLDHWATQAPDRPFLVERDGGGSWRTHSFSAVAEASLRLASALLSLPVSPERPLMILSPNSARMAAFMFAAMRLGVPAAVITPAYATASTQTAKLQHIFGLLTPGAIYAPDAASVLPGLSSLEMGDTVVLTDTPCAGLATKVAEALPLGTRAAVLARQAQVGPQTAAKLLFTSGSTGLPKGVINTHAMMCTNQAGLAAVWPFLNGSAPVLVDWLPWSHTFGGNCCFNLALQFGGTLHIDSGRPAPGALAPTLANLREISPTIYFNVPAGYDALLPHLEGDETLARSFFARLRFMFSAGAALPAGLRRRLEAVAARHRAGPPPVIGGWGSTETAPVSTVVYFATAEAANLGVPLPGVAIKLAPEGGRHELRVRGPNVTPGYWRDAQATVSAFDAEGFLKVGDAGRLADPERPQEGLLFDGRIAENFKLASGTWVNVGAVRLAVIDACAPLVADVVVAGHDRDRLGLLVFPNLHTLGRRLGEVSDGPQSAAAIAERLQAYNRIHPGSSTRIAEFLILVEPPCASNGEITEKGYINQRAVLERRAGDVARLFAEGASVDPAAP